MSILVKKRDYLQWVSSLNLDDLSDTERKLLNLLIANFDDIALLGTYNGARAKKIGKLVEESHESLANNVLISSFQGESDSLSHTKISEVSIGPFRGFTSTEHYTMKAV